MPFLRAWCSVIVLCAVSVLINAQTPQVTVTPAPTKTPAATTIEIPTIEAEQPVMGESNFAEPFTQEDLSVLVGNVQRPNGIVWFNGQLYTACSGDFTVYRIDAVTGQTETLVNGVQNTHTLYAEVNGTGFNLFLPDFETGKLLLVTEKRAAPRTIASDLAGPWGIIALNEQEFLISNIRDNTLATVNREGDVNISLSGLRAPAGIAADDDYVYIVNNGSARRAIEYVSRDELGNLDATPKSLVSGLQNASGLVLASDNYLYFTYALGTRGVVGRVLPESCEDGCTNEDVEIVLYTDLQAPLSGLAITPEMRLFVHTIFRPEIYYVDIYGS